MAADIYLTLKPRKQSLVHSWKTSILRSMGGEEWRSALYTWPRYGSKLSFKSNTRGETNWLRRNLSKYKHKVWGIPVWNDLTALRAVVPATQLKIQVEDTSYRHWYPGRKFILIDKDDYTNYETGVVTSVSGTTIAASDLIASEWAKADTYLCPLYECRLGSGFDIRRYGAITDDIVIDVSEDMATVAAFSYDPPTNASTYLGHPVFDYPIQTGHSLRFLHPNMTTEGIGKFAVESFYDDDDTHYNMSFNVFLGTRADVRGALDFFDSRLGQYDSFWMPTWNQDLYLASAVTAGATLLNVVDYEYDSLFAANEVLNRYLFIALPDRTYVCRKITAATANTITLDAAIGVPIREIEFPRMALSFMNLSRFNSDRIELVFTREGVAEFAMGTFGLLKETP